jgi:hypothetical protein
MTRIRGDADRRPAGAVLVPLVLLALLAATGLGMWRVLSHDAAPVEARLSWHRPAASE